MRFFLLPLCFCFSYSIQAQQAQSVEQIAAGQNYTQQAYYSLATGESIQIPHDSWDLAFTAMGLQDAGLHVNESSELSDGEEASKTLLYAATTKVFEDVTALEDTAVPLLNSEKHWNGGAANVIRDTENPFDYGWGIYNPATNEVIGQRIYIIKLRDDRYKKFIVESLIESLYTLRYANLDGSEEHRLTINKTDFSDGGLAFFSFETEEVFGVQKYDLSISRYSTLAVNPTDNTDTLEYLVTGILAAPNVRVAEIRDVPTEQVDLDTPASFSDELHVIGHDWKTFAFIDGWVITENLSYLVETAEGEMYKIVLIDFEGATTGVASFLKTKYDTPTNLTNNDFIQAYHVFPNPTLGELTISYDLATPQKNIAVEVYNQLGQVVWQRTIQGTLGLNARQLDLSILAKGQYFLHLKSPDFKTVQAIQIQ